MPPLPESIQVSVPRTAPTTIPSTRRATKIVRRSAPAGSSAPERARPTSQTAGSNTPQDSATTMRAPTPQTQRSRSIFRFDSPAPPKRPRTSPLPQRLQTSPPFPQATEVRCVEMADRIAKTQKVGPAKYTAMRSSERRQQTPVGTTAYESRPLRVPVASPEVLYII